MLRISILLFLVACLPAAAGAAPLSGDDTPVDTGAIAAFGAGDDPAGNIWVALGWPDNKLQLFRSTDQGWSWQSALWFPLDGTARRIEVVSPWADPSFLYVFYLTSAGAGDLWLSRVNTGTLTWENLPVAVGQDTIDDFSAAADRDSLYYLYCLYVNEQRTGLTGHFTRSFDRGRSWEFPLDWWNAWDPCVAAGRGPTVHCVWRYSPTGREIHYSANHRYGQPSRWQEYRVLSVGAGKCWDPVVAAGDTLADAGSPVWVAYTVGRRDTAMTDLECAASADDGYNWTTGQVVGQPFVDEWAPVLAVDRRCPGFVDLAYNSGGSRSDDATAVAWRSAYFADTGFWSGPVILNDRRAAVRYEGAWPRLAYGGAHTPRGPLVLFSHNRPNRPEGVYVDAPWRPFPAPGSLPPDSGSLVCLPSLSRGSAMLRFSGADRETRSLMVCDVSGRVVRALSAGRGASGVIWDLRDHAGRLVPNGTYLVRVPGTRERAVLTICR